ncbi:MAG: PAS domain S-box protein [Methanolinea sp.]|jgi:PAS domain S-box-containing protein|nr:PAS domain S-box protein [Methanolinea sp.]
MTPFLKARLPLCIQGQKAWDAAIILFSGGAIVLTLYCSLLGITTVFMHIYYIPVVLLAYRYRWSGMGGIAALVLAYLAITAAFFRGETTVIVTALVRAGVFIAIGAIIASLSERILLVQKETEESRKLKESIIQNANVWVMLLDSGGYVQEWNSAAERMSGYSATEVTGQNEIWKKIYPDREYRKTITGKIRDIIGKNRYFENLETTITCRDGSQKVILWNTRSLGRKPGEKELFVAIGTDITAIKRAEEELLESKRFLEEILDTINVRVFWKDKNLIYMGCNRSFARDAGYERSEDVIGKDDFQMPWKDQAERYRADDRQVIGTGSPRMLYEEPQTTPSGETLSLLTSKVPLSDLKGNIIGVLGVYVDISDLKKAEKALKESLNRTEAILKALPDLLFVISPDGIFHEFHCHDEGMLVRPPEEYIGKSIYSVGYPRESADKFVQHVNIALETGKIQSITYSLTIRGEKRYFEGRIVALTGDRALVIARDITDRVLRERMQERFTSELEEQVRRRTESLEAALHERELLLREIHHRVKNNLQVIISLINLQVRTMEKSGATDILLDTQSRIRAMALVHEKLYQSGNLSRIDIASYLRSLVSQVSAYHGTKKQKVTLSIACESLSMDINRAISLGLIINELAGNSLKHAFPGDREGTVTIRVERKDNRIECTVSDDGVGLPPGFTIEDSGSLGLRLVTTLAKQLNGEIEKVPTEKGTTFRLVIPGGEA